MEKEREGRKLREWEREEEKKKKERELRVGKKNRTGELEREDGR